jgi:hypothetical protein
MEILVQWCGRFIATARNPAKLILLDEWLFYEQEYFCQWSNSWKSISTTCKHFFVVYIEFEVLAKLVKKSYLEYNFLTSSARTSNLYK